MENVEIRSRPLAGRQILVVVCGSVAAPKSQVLVSDLVKAGAVVDVLLTSTAQRFIGPWAFEALTSGVVLTGVEATHPVLGPEPHIALARRATAAIVYPASASCINALSLGLPLGNAPLVLMNIDPQRLLIAPAMSTEMWRHPATVEHVERLRSWGISFLGPNTGRLASGAVGEGRLIEPLDAAIFTRQAVGRILGDLRGKRIVISAGGLRERIDAARVLTNRSSGRQGYALAEAARDRGATVSLITASPLPPPPGMAIVIEVDDCASFQAAVVEQCANADAYIGAAAVTDFRPTSLPDGSPKLERGNDTLTLELTANPDVIAELRVDGLVKVAFAAEAGGGLARVKEKLLRKGAAMIVANDITASGSGFDGVTNRITIVERSGATEVVPRDGESALHKYDIAMRILDRLAVILEGNVSSDSRVIGAN